MGLLEDIGGAVGNAFGAFADFIGDAFNGVINGVFDNLANIGAGVLRRGIVELHGSETDVLDSTKALLTDADAFFDEDIYKQLMDLTDYKGALPAADGEVRGLHAWKKAKDALNQGALSALILETISAGQIDGGGSFFNIYNAALGLPQLTSSYMSMRWQTALLTPYQKSLNARYQNNLPGANDIVRFALREVFDDDQREILLSNKPGGKYSDTMKELGFTEYWSDSYWAAHWVLPSVSQLNEMLYRGKIEIEDWEKYVRYNDYLPAMIPKLKEIIFKPYTRVDVRRMYDVGVLSDEELLQSYKDQGYDDIHAENMALWTRVYIAVGELRARYSKGWITKEELKQSFVDLGMSPAKAQTYTEKLVKAEGEAAAGKERDLTKTDITRSVAKGLISQDDGIFRLMDLGYEEDEATFLIQNVISEAVAEELTIDRDISKTEIIEGVKLGIISRAESIPMIEKLGYTTDEANYILDLRVLPVHTARIIKERDLTKAELVKGVKKGIITDVQAVQMLQDMGYDLAESEYIIDINVEAALGSPASWSEFQRIINRDRKARGQVVKPIPAEIATLESQIKVLEQSLTKATEEKQTHPELEAIRTKLNPLKRQHNEAVRRYRI